MISAKNLLVNVSTKLDTTANTQEHGKVELNLDQNDGNNTQDAQNAVDPGAFMALFGQVLSSTMPITQQVDTNQVATESNEDLNNTITTSDLNDLLTSGEQTDNPQLNQPPLFTEAEQVQTQTLMGTTSLDMKQKQTTESAMNPDELIQTIAAGSDTPLEQRILPETQTTALLKNLTPKLSEEVKRDVEQIQASDYQYSAIPLMNELDPNQFEVQSQGNPDALTVSNDKSLQAGAAIPTMPTNQPQSTVAETKTITIPVQVTDPSWRDKFAEHIVWLGQNEIKSATIKVHPEELGPLEISVKVIKDTASVSILGHNVDAKNIVDQAMPRLRDMMAEQGINLTNVHIDFDQKSREFSQPQNRDNTPFNSEGLETSEPELVTPLKRPPKGLIDYFA